MIRLPGLCIVCREPVVWTGQHWKAAINLERTHICPEDRAVCGAWMVRVKERCARRPRHGTPHRTAYALANARRMRGCEVPRARYNPGVGSSDESNTIADGARLSATTRLAGVIASIEVVAR